MEGEEILASMDSLWFYSSVFLQASSSKHRQRNCAEGPQPRQRQESAETRRATSDSAGQAPRCCVKEEVAPTEPRAASGTARTAAASAAARGCREWDERMVAWQREQRRRTRMAAAARCSQALMPPPGEGVPMKARLRSWAHAVACSVR